MAKYENLKFFDSQSNDLNMSYDSVAEKWTGNVYLPEVSAGLFETTTIYILEEVEGTLGQTGYVNPISENGNSVKFRFNFTNEYGSSDDVYLYKAESRDSKFYVKRIEHFDADLQDASVSSSVSNGIKVISSKPKTIPMSCNVTLSSQVEDYHSRILQIHERVGDVNTHLVAEIRIYGEVEGEDERLKDLLTNIGMNLEEADYLLFKRSDVKELSPNYHIINEKRRELLLEASQIKSFIGTYKALLNAIKFYGYDNLTLKEYWLNINEQAESFGKLIAVAVPNQEIKGFLAAKNIDKELPNSNHKKTSRFSLVYRLNNFNGEYDKYDLPQVEEVFDFSPDEILIKLYGLKNKLQKYYLPLQAKIIDITGEGDYFTRVNTRVFDNQQKIEDIDEGVRVAYEVTPDIRRVFVEDLRKVDYRLTGLGQDFDALIISNDKQAVMDNIDGFYGSYYDTDMNSFQTLDGIPIGAPINLKANSIPQTWDSADFTFLDVEESGDDLHWNNWWYRNIYEVEWVITGPNNYSKILRGPIAYYYEVPIVLPYHGTYNVELAFHDLFNVRSVDRKPQSIIVSQKEVEIYGVYEKIYPQLSWRDYKTPWEISGSSWDWAHENREEVRDVIGTYYLTLNRANYLHGIENGFQFSMVRRYLDPSSPTGYSETPGPYQWRNLRTHQWNDGDQVSWEMTRVGADINSSFKIDLRVDQGHTGNGELILTWVDPSDNLVQTDSYTITSAYPADSSDLNGWQAIADELNALTAEDHPRLSRFNYNPVFVDVDGTVVSGYTLGQDTCEFILAVAEEPGRNYDFTDIQISDGSISGEQQYTSYNPSFENLNILRDHETVKMLNHLTFSYDLTNMPGIIKQVWTLINNSLDEKDIYYNNQWLTYLFENKGDYTIKLELTDSNGNKNVTTKNILTIN
jgi:hypothetical protein